MSTIDERVVAMRFQNSQFEQGIKQSSKSLEDLKKNLNLDGSKKGLQDLASYAKNFTLDGLSKGVDTIASKFNTLAVVGITALANITNRAVNAGVQLAKSLTIDPIKAGFDEYELKMGSIQTILANTARYGTNLEQVTGALEELNSYADKTIYNFGDMTKNIGLFTNAGIRVEDATAMIKGFSNEAAASGTTSAGAAGAAYQLSQALSAGTIRLMDWRSLTNVGMGNKNMQNGLIEIADAMGLLNSKTITAEDVAKDFNGSLEKNWLSADVMSSYLKIMAGDMTAAEQAALGLSDAQIKAFAKQQATAEEAATKVRTWTQLVGTLQESVGSSWAQTADLLIGDFNQATKLWTAANDALGPMIGAAGDARNKLLEGWAELGGRDMAIDAIVNGFQAIMGFIKPIQDAFRDIFPPMTAKTLYEITVNIRDFFASLKMGEKDSANLRATFRGIFAVLDIGRMILAQVFSLFGRLFGSAQQAGSGFLEVTGNVGDFLVKVRDAIRDGDGLVKVFNWIEGAIRNLVGGLRDMGKYLTDNVKIESFADVWQSVGNALQKVWTFLSPIVQWIGDALKQLGEGVKTAFETMDFNVLVGLLNVGAIGAVAIVIRKGFGKLIDFIKGIAGGSGDGLFDKIKGAFGALTDTLGEMQNTLKSAQLLTIAAAIGILTASVVALSFIDTGKLFVVLGAMGVMFAQLVGVMVILDKVVASKGFMKMPFIAASMIAMATAMVIFSAAVKIMSTMEWEELAKGLSGLAVGLGLLVAASALLGKVPAKLFVTAPALIAISTALVILAAALKIMGSMSWDEVARGMATLGGSLGLLVAAMAALKGASFGVASMLIVAAAMTVLAGALKIMASMSWDEIARGLATLAGSLAIMTAAIALTSGGLMGAAAILVISAAMVVLSGALKVMASMTWDEIGRGMAVLGGSLAILAAAMALMGIPLVLLGAIGITAASVALMLLAPALVLLGTMSWDAIGRGLTMLGAALAILAVGGVLLLPAIPAFLGLGAAVALLGIGTLAAGAGLAAMAAGIAALAAAGPAGAKALSDAVLIIINLIPKAMQAFAQGLIDFAVVIANGGAEFTKAMVTLLTSLIDAVNTLAPKIIDTIGDLVMKLVSRLERDIPRFVSAGMKLITGVLNGIAKNLPAMIEAGVSIIVAILDGIGKSAERLANAGFEMVIDIIEGLTRSIKSNSARLGKAGGDLAVAIIDGMVNGIGAGIGRIISAAQNMAANALQAAKDFLGIASPSKEFAKLGVFVNQGFAKGMLGSRDQIQAAYDSMKGLLKDAISSANEDIKRHTSNIEKLRKARSDDLKELQAAQKELKKKKSEGKDTTALEKRIKKLTESRAEDLKAINAEKKALAQARAEKKKSEKAYEALTTKIKGQVREQKKLAKELADVEADLEEARKKYADAKKVRDDYKASVKDSFSQLGDIGEDTNLQQYEQDLQKQIEDTIEFTARMAELREKGLNDKLYKELISKGTTALPFIEQLLASGEAGIKDLNGLSDQLDAVAGELGSNASNELYQAAVDSARGIVVGLKEQRAEIIAEMEEIGKAMATAIKKALGIKSPSRVMAEVGKFANAGVVKGLKDTIGSVAKASDNVGTTAVDHLKKSLSDISSAVATDMNLDPTIRPVLDMSDIRKGAGELDNLLKLPTLDITGSYNLAKTTSAAVRAGQMTDVSDASETDLAARIQFIQNNNSPKALSSVEIYRQTKNQLSKAKEVLTK